MTEPDGASAAARILSLQPDGAPAPAAAGPQSDADWLTLCLYYEARGEIQDGKAAVARVILNRAQRRPPFFSDGTVRGTILHPSQFSWVNWAFVSGHYIKVAVTPAEVEARVAKLHAQALADRLIWGACADVAHEVLAGSYAGGDAYRQLGPDALLYDNLAVSRPAWATPDKQICTVGHHAFFRP